jgi:(2R)-3-sulfolactate dehydrogenase (NADP+)
MEGRLMILTLDEVEHLSRRALMRAGASDRQAAPVARSIRAAEAEGTRGIGLGYLPWYCQHLRVGKIQGAAVAKVEMRRPAAIMSDAGGGFAHPAYEAGEALLIAAAKSQGIAILGVKDAYACGVLGYFTDRLARSGLVALAFTNASSTMAPWGGKVPFFGTNPWAFGAPRHGDPLVIDSASSATAFVNLAGRPWLPDHRCKSGTDRFHRTGRRAQGGRSGLDGRGDGRRSDRIKLVLSSVFFRR